jgi:hypothetical protein
MRPTIHFPAPVEHELVVAGDDRDADAQRIGDIALVARVADVERHAIGIDPTAGETDEPTVEEADAALRRRGH